MRNATKLFYEMVGHKYNRLFVSKIVLGRGKDTRLECLCECGKVVTPKAINVKSGISSSCGCLPREKRRESINNSGVYKTRVTRIWMGMMARCNNKKSPYYKYYGGRGISVCKEWAEDYHQFKAWAEMNGYSDNLEIDRIDNDKDYSPQNCKWATRQQQLENRRCTLRVLFNGEMITLAEGCRITGIRYGKALYRKKSGYSDEDIFRDDKMQKREQNKFKTRNWRTAI
jgi:hypothetical protein